MALIFTLSAIPRGFDLSTFPLRDKGVHVVEYAVLAWLNARALRHTFPEAPLWRTALGAAAVAVGWGYLDEVHQAFVPGRDASLGDLVADSVGACLGAAGHALARRVLGAQKFT
jgi:VanZ family protein